MTVSEWADQNRVLSSETSASPGKWVTYSFQKEMMDAFSDPLVEQVVIMSGSQLGKTEILLNVLGYHIDLDPSPIMIIQPTLTMAGTFSKNRITPMIRDSKKLSNKVKDPRSRDSGNTVYSKSFTGGSLDLIGSNSPSSASSRPVRILLCDEVDRYSTATTEGDIIGLGKRRTSNFFNRKIGMVSTPTIKGNSRIQQFYEQGDQRKFYVRCPDCNDETLLEWKDVHFQKDNGILKDANIVCKGCGSAWDDSKRVNAISNGYWKPNAEFNGTRSFWISGLYSMWNSTYEQANYFHQAKDLPETLRVFVNTVLAETWDEDAGESVDSYKLKERAEEYEEDLMSFTQGKKEYDWYESRSKKKKHLDFYHPTGYDDVIVLKEHGIVTLADFEETFGAETMGAESYELSEILFEDVNGDLYTTDSDFDHSLISDMVDDEDLVPYEGETFGAESKFDKLAKEIAADYRKKGKSPEEALEIGEATAAKIGRAKFGKKKFARMGKKAETFTNTLLPAFGLGAIGAVVYSIFLNRKKE